LIIVEPDYLQVREVLEVLETGEHSIGEMHLCEVTGVFRILDGQHRPGVAYFLFNFYHLKEFCFNLKLRFI
jgi:hypothetical protein